MTMMMELCGLALLLIAFFFQAEDGIRDYKVTGVQTCALPICALSGVALCGGRCVCHFVFLVGAMACMVPREGRAAHPPAVRSDKAEELGARRREIGRAACRGRGEISGVAGSFKKKQISIRLTC